MDRTHFDTENPRDRNLAILRAIKQYCEQLPNAPFLALRYQESSPASLRSWSVADLSTVGLHRRDCPMKTRRTSTAPSANAQSPMQYAIGKQPCRDPLGSCRPVT